MFEDQPLNPKSNPSPKAEDIFDRVEPSGKSGAGNFEPEIEEEPVKPAPPVPGEPSVPSPISFEASEERGGKKGVVIAAIVVAIVLIAGAAFGYYYFFRPGPVEIKAPADKPPVDLDKNVDVEANVDAGRNVAEEVDAELPPAVEPETIVVQDSDSDGLSDEEEKTLGTDPFDVDTDKDGLFDKEEVKVYKTNPLNEDSDGDNYLDGEEVRNGYSPLGPGRLDNLPADDEAVKETAAESVELKTTE